MSYRERLLNEARKAIGECPQRREEIIDLLELAVSEIEDGGSAAHEYELFINSVAAMQLARGA